MASVKKCECSAKHEFQDKKYGKGNRIAIPIWNPGKKKNDWRCTVCGKDFKNDSEAQFVNA